MFMVLKHAENVGAPEYQEEGRRKQRDSMRRTSEESAVIGPSCSKRRRKPLFLNEILNKIIMIKK